MQAHSMGVGVGVLAALLSCPSCGGRVRRSPGEGVGGAARASTGSSTAAGTVATAGAGGSATGLGASASSGTTLEGEATAPTELPPCAEISGLPDDCWQERHSVDHQAVNILLVVDKSGSMDDESIYDGRMTWEILVEALNRALREQPGISSELRTGLLLFPGRDVPSYCPTETCCSLGSEDVDVEIAPLEDSSDAILDTLAQTTPGGLTPTAAALERARVYFTEGAGRDFGGDRVVVLITDGGPICNPTLRCGMDECMLNLDTMCLGAESSNCCSTDASGIWCVDHEATEEKFIELRSAGIESVIIGLPGSEPYVQWLRAFAEIGSGAGGTMSHYYDVSVSREPGDVSEALRNALFDPTRDCMIQLIERPDDWDLTRIDVAVDCSLVPSGISEDDGLPVDGWTVDDPLDPTTIQLHGRYCEQLQGGVDRVDVVYGCE